jgi:hypothetical protein
VYERTDNPYNTPGRRTIPEGQTEDLEGRTGAPRRSGGAPKEELHHRRRLAVFALRDMGGKDRQRVVGRGIERQQVGSVLLGFGTQRRQ